MLVSFGERPWLELMGLPFWVRPFAQLLALAFTPVLKFAEERPKDIIIKLENQVSYLWSLFWCPCGGSFGICVKCTQVGTDSNGVTFLCEELGNDA